MMIHHHRHHHHLFRPPILSSELTFFLCISITVAVVASPGADGDVDERFAACQATRKCGRYLEDIKYPFWGNNIRPQYCGRQGFELRCHEDDYATVDIGGQTFEVIDINDARQIMVITKHEFLEGNFSCPLIFQETRIDNDDLFSYSENVGSLSLFFECSDPLTHHLGNNTFSCQDLEGGDFKESFYRLDGEKNPSLFPNLSMSCSKVIKVPIQNTQLNIRYLLEGKLSEALSLGFEVRYNSDSKSCSNCSASQGICGSNQTSNEFLCLCQSRAYSDMCLVPPGEKRNLALKVGIGFGAAVVGMAIMAFIFLIHQTRKKNKNSSSALISRKYSSDPSSRSDLENGDTFPGVHVFSYSELEEATNYFDSSRELGDGGFGTVYYGKLQDGRAVAVKRLYENNYKRVEQFMNEVDILAGLRHENLVSLYGCTSRHSRELLLVYEFVPNGTVADHLHGERAKPGALPWPTRLKIAIETASALTYLHATDIIHRDVKTTNILLDKNFCVKVADFGLSRLFPNHVTHVSTAPQGTPGYVDPEYHQCYQLTERSDVFSLGVVLIELISSMPAVDITRHRYEINLSNLAINKIQNKALHELVDPTLGYESDYKVRKTVNAVAELAFQCLQSEKELRPYMVDVFETLKDIETDGYNKKRTEEILMESPISVTQIWNSTQTTPNPSS